MNVVHVPRRFVRSHWGGTETVILETCKALLRMGHETQVICANALATEDQEVIENVQVLRVPYFYPYLGLTTEAKALLDRKGGNLFSFALMRCLESVPNLDLIHLHTAKRVGGIGRYVARKKRLPYVVTLHGGLFDVPAEEAATWTEPTRGALEWGKLLGWWVGSRRVLDDASAIMCVGEEETAKVQAGYPGKKVVHLPNGVDTDRFESGDGQAFRKSHGLPPDAFVILTVGRIDPQKNQLFVVNLLPELARIQPKAHYLIIGPVTHDEYYRELTSSVRNAGLEGRVTVIPGLDAGSQDLVDAYHSSDLFLLPSVHEPFGIVILEAWASGIPVVASRIGGIPSFVVPNETGALFEANDAESLFAAFRSLVQYPEQARRRVEAGRKKARSQYSWDVITSRLMDVYEDALSENPFRK
jgi:glycosyltransferase involved in cell wall biosynthesis